MYLSNGNRKLGGGFLIWSLPAKKTCIGSTPLCRKNCYSDKAERLYPKCLPSRERNLIDSKSDLFAEVMIAYITATAPPRFNGYFRIHESGDFYSQDYLNKWITIATRLPSIKFLAFTQSYQLDYFKKPQNMEIVFSVWEDSKNVPDYFPKYYIGKQKGAIECKYKCNECFKCWQLTKLKKNVWTEKHRH